MCCSAVRSIPSALASGSDHLMPVACPACAARGLAMLTEEQHDDHTLFVRKSLRQSHHQCCGWPRWWGALLVVCDRPVTSRVARRGRRVMASAEEETSGHLHRPHPWHTCCAIVCTTRDSSFVPYAPQLVEERCLHGVPSWLVLRRSEKTVPGYRHCFFFFFFSCLLIFLCFVPFHFTLSHTPLLVHRGMSTKKPPQDVQAREIGLQSRYYYLNKASRSRVGCRPWTPRRLDRASSPV